MADRLPWLRYPIVAGEPRSAGAVDFAGHFLWDAALSGGPTPASPASDSDHADRVCLMMFPGVAGRLVGGPAEPQHVLRGHRCLAADGPGELGTRAEAFAAKPFAGPPAATLYPALARRWPGGTALHPVEPAGSRHPPGPARPRPGQPDVSIRRGARSELVAAAAAVAEQRLPAPRRAATEPAPLPRSSRPSWR